jgi:hypothetical protein
MILIPVAIAAVLMFQQGRPETHTLGKTPQQVVAMGRQKWFDFYTASQGDSTMASVDAERTFATCLASITNTKITKLPKAKQAELAHLRDLMRATGVKVIECGMALTGGGSIWNLFGASQEVDVEETMADLVTMPKKPSTATQAEFWKQVKIAKELIDENAENIDQNAGTGGLKASEALGRLESIKSDFSASVKIISSWPTAKRGRVMSYFAEAVSRISNEM